MSDIINSNSKTFHNYKGVSISSIVLCIIGIITTYITIFVYLDKIKTGKISKTILFMGEICLLINIIMIGRVYSDFLDESKSIKEENEMYKIIMIIILAYSCMCFLIVLIGGVIKLLSYL